MKSNMRTVTLYRDKPPTSSQLRFGDRDLPIIAVDETGDMGTPGQDLDDRRLSFTVVGALIEDRKQFVKTRDTFSKDEVQYDHSERGQTYL